MNTAEKDSAKAPLLPAEYQKTPPAVWQSPTPASTSINSTGFWYQVRMTWNTDTTPPVPLLQGVMSPAVFEQALQRLDQAAKIGRTAYVCSVLFAILLLLVWTTMYVISITSLEFRPIYLPIVIFLAGEFAYIAVMIFLARRRKRTVATNVRRQCAIENAQVFGPAGIYVQYAEASSRYSPAMLTFYRCPAVPYSGAPALV